tara:strand:- start:687 stop:806 length:120 start_codon:yes stop_codon:yes gene_type:complete
MSEDHDVLLVLLEENDNNNVYLSEGLEIDSESLTLIESD